MKITGFSQELRATDEKQLILEGKAIAFNSPTVLYEIGGTKYREVISPSALDGTDLSDVPLKYNHDSAFIILARTRNKSLRLEKRPDGLHMVAQLQQDIQSHRDVFSAVKSGLLNKMSFAFSVDAGGETYDRATHTRTITKIRKLFDVAIVNQPAYEQTFVEARSRLQELAETDARREALTLKINLIRRILA